MVIAQSCVWCHAFDASFLEPQPGSSTAHRNCWISSVVKKLKRPGVWSWHRVFLELVCASSAGEPLMIFWTKNANHGTKPSVHHQIIRTWPSVNYPLVNSWLTDGWLMVALKPQRSRFPTSFSPSATQAALQLELRDPVSPGGVAGVADRSRGAELVKVLSNGWYRVKGWLKVVISTKLLYTNPIVTVG